MYVYNTDTDNCREVLITPNCGWGGEGRYGDYHAGSRSTASLPLHGCPEQFPALFLCLQSRLQHRLRLPAQGPQTAVWRRPEDEAPCPRRLQDTLWGPQVGWGSYQHWQKTLCSSGPPFGCRPDGPHPLVCSRTASYLFKPNRLTSNLSHFLLLQTTHDDFGFVPILIVPSSQRVPLSFSPAATLSGHYSAPQHLEADSPVSQQSLMMAFTGGNFWASGMFITYIMNLRQYHLLCSKDPLGQPELSSIARLTITISCCDLWPLSGAPQDAPNTPPTGALPSLADASVKITITAEGQWQVTLSGCGGLAPPDAAPVCSCLRPVHSQGLYGCQSTIIPIYACYHGNWHHTPDLVWCGFRLAFGGIF